MTLCVCGHALYTEHAQTDEHLVCLECSCQEYRKAAPEDRSLSAGVTPEGLAGETVSESVNSDEARAGEPRTEAGRASLEAKLGIMLGLWPVRIDVGRNRQGFIQYLANFIEREAAAAPACNCPLLCCDSHE